MTDPNLSYTWVFGQSTMIHGTNTMTQSSKKRGNHYPPRLDRWCMPMEKTVDILKKLIFTEITFAAEITTPSTAVINKVDRFSCLKNKDREMIGPVN